MKKEQFIKNKIKALKGGGYSTPQANAIAYATFNGQKNMQFGGSFNQFKNVNPSLNLQNLDYNNLNQEQILSNSQNFINNNPIPFTQSLPQGISDSSESFANRTTENFKDYTSDQNELDALKTSMQPNQQYNDITRYNIQNPYGDVNALGFLGQSIGEGNASGIGMGAGLFALQGSRNFLSGLASGRDKRGSMQEMQDNINRPQTNYEYTQQGGYTQVEQNDLSQIQKDSGVQFTLEGAQALFGRGIAQNGNFPPTNPNIVKYQEGVTDSKSGIDGDRIYYNYPPRSSEDYKNVTKAEMMEVRKTPQWRSYTNKGMQTNPIANYQQGGKKEITNAQNMTGQFLTDQGYGNTNAEGGEYFADGQTGEVKEIVGEPHIKKGKIADGVNLNLDQGDMILADYQKLSSSNIKELKERYDISLKKGATPADAQKAFDKKLGIKKTTDKLTAYIEQMEKASNVKDEVTRGLNENHVASEIEETTKKLNTLKAPQAMFFQDVFAMQEAQPKKGNPGELLDKNGKAITETLDDQKQQGGRVGELAKKYGISPERAEELLMQQGGMQPAEEEVNPQEQQAQVDPQQIMQMVAQALQNGTDPQDVLQQLIQNGIPEEQAVQMIEGVMQQMQPQEEQQMAQQGNKYYENNPPLFMLPNATTSVNSTNTLNFENAPRSINDLPYTPRDISLNNIWKGDNYGKNWIPLVEESMKDPKKAEKIENWLLSTKNQYSENVKEQLKGLTGEARKNRITQLATDGKPGLYHNAFLEAIKEVGTPAENEKVAILEKPSSITGEKASIEQRNITKNVMSNPIQRMMYMPEMDTIAKEQIYLDRIDPIKATTEPMLAEQERQRQTDVARFQNSGLSTIQQEALLASGLASSQMASNDAISKVENFNAQNQFSADQFNIGQRSKEDITNSQFNQDYQGKVLGGLNAYRDDLQGLANQSFVDQSAAQNNVRSMNYYNAGLDNYAITDNGIEYLNNKSTDIGLPFLSEEELSKMTPQQRIEYMKNFRADAKKYTAQLGGRFNY